MHPITENHFYQYAKCPMWIFRDSKVSKKEITSLDRALIENGLLSDVRRQIMSSRGYEEVDIEDHDEAFEKTVQLMEAGVQTILHGALAHGRYVARPDVLERVEGRSRFGDYYYIAADLKRSHSIRRGTKLAAAFYAEVLRLVQGVKPNQGYMMNPEGDVLSFVLTEFEEEFHLTLHNIERILAGERPGVFISSRCKNSPWFDECKSDAAECDSLSRVNRIMQEEVQMFAKAGYKTLTQFVEAPFDDLLGAVDVTEERLNILYTQAQALVNGDVVLVDPPVVVDQPIELFFDIESDPLRDVDYLFGILETKINSRGARRRVYKQFLAKEPSGEKAAWREFVRYLESLPDAPIYHYGWFEVDEVRRLGARYDAPQKTIEAILARMIDVLGLIRGQIIFPLSFYSLKDIAKYLGFDWRHPEASGANSILWYEDWLTKGDEVKLQDVIDYNEDDVRATEVLKVWISKQVNG